VFFISYSRENVHVSGFLPGHPDEFLYLNQGGNPFIDGVDDAEQFEDTCEAFDLLGVHQDEQAKIFQVLAAILHLGNIDIGEDDGHESTRINVSMDRDHSSWDGGGTIEVPALMVVMVMMEMVMVVVATAVVMEVNVVLMKMVVVMISVVVIMVRNVVWTNYNSYDGSV
jgi:hypothetical protein